MTPEKPRRSDLSDLDPGQVSTRNYVAQGQNEFCADKIYKGMIRHDRREHIYNSLHLQILRLHSAQADRAV